jgi:hypothetical protein
MAASATAADTLNAVPRRTQRRSHLAQFFGERLRSGHRRFGQNERQRPRCIFHRQIVLPHFGLERARHLLQVPLKLHFSVLLQKFLPAVQLHHRDR